MPNFADHRARIARAAIALVAGMACSAGAARAQPQLAKIINDNQAYSAGAYLAYIAPFNKGHLVQGKDYTESIAIEPASFPAHSQFIWHWPDKAAPAGVYNFNAVDFGDYDNTIVHDPVPSRPIGQIRVLSETHDASFEGQLEGFDVIDDLFLTTKSGDNATNAFEVEVFLHTPSYSADYVRGAEQIGIFSGSGTLWTVAVDRPKGRAPDILFMPSDRADISQGTIDLQAMLAYLVVSGVIPATLYFNGLGFGTETQRGAGSMDVKVLEVSYE